MNLELLEILRCPFCGSRLELQQSSLLEVQDGEVSTGILGCQCCAYPIVSGIPYIVSDAAAWTAMRLLEEGEKEQALFTLFGLEEQKQKQLQSLLSGERAMTFRNAMQIFRPDLEGQYFLYRFSDPTFLVSDAMLRAVGQDRRCSAGYVLDLGGGTGHLTRSLCKLDEPDRVILADLSFWELWLAKRFLAPCCQPVCCNANDPLPFARDIFSLVFCSGTFEYIWSRRMLASEMVRLVGGSGAIVVTHMHNALCENPSEGMPLDPGGYRSLFEGLSPRLFKESVMLDAILDGSPLDLSTDYSDEELEQEPALIVVATRLEGFFRIYERPAAEPLARPAINPLYRVEQREDSRLLTLRFPSDYYEMEFADCKRYLPERVELTAGQLTSLKMGESGSESKELAERYVLLDLPEDYL